MTREPLSWDDHVGWEPRHHFAPGERSYTRPEGAVVTLEYALGPNFVAIAGRSAGMPLEDKPLIVRNAHEPCDPSLRAAIASLRPERLLVHIEADLDTVGRDCLAQLQVPDLFLSTCRHDGALAGMDHCADGDAQLALIAGSDPLREKVRGLAIGFGEERSWALLGRFPRLAQLVVRGTALEHVDPRGAWGLCALRELSYVDALNAYQPGAQFPLLPPQCILRWTTFSAWSLQPLAPWLDQAPSFPTVRCELEHVTAERISEDHRRVLLSACPRLRELEVMHPLERCVRSSADEPLTCRGI